MKKKNIKKRINIHVEAQPICKQSGKITNWKTLGWKESQDDRYRQNRKNWAEFGSDSETVCSKTDDRTLADWDISAAKLAEYA